MFLESFFRDAKPAFRPVGPIRAGDILVKEGDGSLLNIMINVAQLYGHAGGYAKWSHAGIAVSDASVAEMSGAGLHESALGGANAGYTYAVFRCKFPNVALGAAETAKMMLGFEKGITYSKSGAVTSLLPSLPVGWDRDRVNTMLDTLLSGGEVSFFCSEHVVFCYLVALEQSGLMPAGNRPSVPTRTSTFASEPIQYSPAYLYEILLNSTVFDYIGLNRGRSWV